MHEAGCRLISTGSAVKFITEQKMRTNASNEDVISSSGGMEEDLKALYLIRGAGEDLVEAGGAKAQRRGNPVTQRHTVSSIRVNSRQF